LKTSPLAAGRTLSWYTTTADRRKLDEWCQTVGPALFRAAGNPVEPTNGRILIVNWNVHVGNGNIEALIEDLKTAELEAGRGRPNFVFLLQEAFRRGEDVPPAVGSTRSIPDRVPSPSSDLDALARKLDWWMFYVPSMRNGKQSGLRAEDRGNAILSSLPLDGLEAIELPFSVQRRVALTAIVQDPHRLRFRVATLHLDTRAPLIRGSVFGAAAARNKQARWAAEAIHRLAGDGMSLIVGGDLNSYWGPMESSIDTLTGVAPRLSCGAGTHATGLTLDHIFARFTSAIRAVSCNRANDRFESDHYPLVLSVVKTSE
jgi:endonuclease/exonuclease/phosphatase family metal-dependent hydrolase